MRLLTNFLKDLQGSRTGQFSLAPLGGFVLLILVFQVSFIQGCAPATTVVDKAAVVVPAEWVFARTARLAPPIDLGEELASFLAGAVGKNYSLQAAAMRVKRAEALHRIASSSLYPDLYLSFDGEKGEVREAGYGRVVSRKFQPVGSMSWELDLWGKIADREDGAAMEYEATFMDWRSARLALCTRITKGWYQGITAGMLVRQAEDIADSYTRTLEAVEERYQTGLADSLDVYMARTALSQAIEQLTANRANENLAIQELQVLAGHYPDGSLQLPEVLPENFLEYPDTGIPADLAMNRPDLLAMHYRVEAADKEWSASLKDLLPTLTLSARAGTAAITIGDSFDPKFGFWQLVAGVTQPVFEGGRLRARAKEAEYAVYQLQLEYCEMLLCAFREVEAALSMEKSLQKQFQQAAETLEHATASWEAAVEQYRQGTADLLTVLVNQRQYLQSRVELISLHNAVLQNAMDLVAALGTGDSYLPVLQQLRGASLGEKLRTEQ